MLSPGTALPFSETKQSDQHVASETSSPIAHSASFDVHHPRSLAERLMASRQLSTLLAKPLTDEDQTVQGMDDASPTKWHLAHTTWFYEAFVLREHLPGYQSFDPQLDYCFNSYYEQKGERHPRAHRGLLTRPSADEVRAYRRHVDDALAKLTVTLENNNSPQADAIKELLELGINHEQQHQELLLTDILALFARNPLRPAYQSNKAHDKCTKQSRWTPEVTWHSFAGGITEVGHDGKTFHYDNEGPRHNALIQPFELAHRLVTNGEWIAFMDDGGYETATLWLSDGWTEVQNNRWLAPGYWERRDEQWQQMTLGGLREIDPFAPVSHISFYEAEAFARWSGYRLPTEFEWEVAARDTEQSGNTMGKGLANGILGPRRVDFQTEAPKQPLTQLFGDVWEWTASAYLPYPGYRPPEGAVGEYNGKFMSNQYVLRGASALTADTHSRPTYRNFFYPDKRWQMTGLRLAKDA